MKKSPLVIRSMVLGWLLLGGAMARLPAQGTAFTYQGTLSANGLPVNSTNDLTFTLFDAPTGGATVGTSNETVGLVITGGLFTQILDFGGGVFDGSPRWLEIGVRPGGSGGAYTALAPRQRLTATPYALTAGNLTGPVPANSLTGTYGNAVTLDNPANVIAGAFSGDGSGLTALNAANVISGRLADARLSTNVALLNARQTFTSTNVFTTANTSSPVTLTNATDNPVALDFRQRYYRWRVGQNRPTDGPTITDSFFIIGDDLGLSPHTRFLIDSVWPETVVFGCTVDCWEGVKREVQGVFCLLLPRSPKSSGDGDTSPAGLGGGLPVWRPQAANARGSSRVRRRANNSRPMTCRLSLITPSPT